MAEGIILAAGLSSRAQGNKMLYPIDHKSMICHAIESMKPHVSHIYVITGHYHVEIQDHLKSLTEVTCVFNENYPLGMFSSVITGVSKVHEDFFILPGDCPLVKKETYEALLKGEGLIRVPVFQGRKGHPIWFEKKWIKPLLEEPMTSNLKTFRDHQGYSMIHVDDSHILNDIDTIETLKSLDTNRRD